MQKYTGRLFRDGAYLDSRTYYDAADVDSRDEQMTAIINAQRDRIVELRRDLDAAIGWAVRQLLHDLPKNRDWLNPDIERVMREFDADRRARGL